MCQLVNTKCSTSFDARCDHEVDFFSFNLLKKTWHVHCVADPISSLRILANDIESIIVTFVYIHNCFFGHTIHLTSQLFLLDRQLISLPQLVPNREHCIAKPNTKVPRMMLSCKEGLAPHPVAAGYSSSYDGHG